VGWVGGLAVVALAARQAWRHLTDNAVMAGGRDGLIPDGIG
jgi:hypothetical protein